MPSKDSEGRIFINFSSFAFLMLSDQLKPSIEYSYNIRKPKKYKISFLLSILIDLEIRR